MDKSAVGWEHHEQIDKHESQKGKFFFVFPAFNNFLTMFFFQITKLDLVVNTESRLTGLTRVLLAGITGNR